MMEEKGYQTDADLGTPERPQSLGNQKEDEETAAEVAPGMPGKGIATPARSSEPEAQGVREEEQEVPEGERKEAGDAVFGWTGLALSILSFFFFPIVFGAAGVILGFFAYRQGARTLGVWAMGLGALAILGALLLTPIFVR